MPGLYENQLLAIKDMIKNPTKEIRDEGYYQLFKLWKENADSTHFIQDLLPIAFQHENLVEELRIRLDELSLNDSITDKFLKEHLEILAAEILKYQPVEQEAEKHADSIAPKQIEPEDQKTKYTSWQKTLIFSILAIMILVSAIILLYVVPEKDHVFSTEIPELKLDYRAPTYLSAHDENTINLLIENTSQIELKGTIILIFDDPEYSINPAQDQNFSAEIDIRPLDKQTKQFNFFLIKVPTHESLSYHFQFVGSDGARYTTNDDVFLISPIPYLRSISKVAFWSFGTLIVASLRDQIKKLGEGTFKKLVDLLKRV